MAVKLLGTDKASEVAKHFCPEIYQEFKSIKDFLTPLILADKNSMEESLYWLINHPTLYYKTTEDENFLYIYYMLFHPFDWSDSSIGFIRKWDSHLFDTEGLCIRHAKYTAQGATDIATIFHNEVKFEENCGIPQVQVQSEGHGISPGRFYANVGHYVVYNRGKINLLNMGEVEGTPAWDSIKRALNSEGVDMPDQQALGGKLWSAPDEAFKRLLKSKK